MTTQVMATVVDGELKLDAPLELPNASRVRLVVEVEESADAGRERRGMEAIEKLIREQPINSGGLRFTRDELYDRN